MLLRASRARRLSIALAAACAAALPVAASASAGAASSVRYVALGDSYSSGLGAGSYIAASGSCDRSTRAYSALWAGVNQAADLLDGQIRAAAARHGDVFADVAPGFAGHEICDGSASWLHAVNFFDLGESYHPTAAGQSGGYLPAFSASAG